MLSLLRTVQTLLTIQIFTTTSCQVIFGEEDLPIQHFTSFNDGQSNGYSFNANIYPRETNIQPISLTNAQFQQNDDMNEKTFQRNDNIDFSKRSEYARSRKVYRIKNPFDKQLEETDRIQKNIATSASGPGASNQFASMQYSLPQEEYLQQFSSENQYFQQTQTSTTPPNIEYTATPLPQQQYQYSTIQYSTGSQPAYDNINQNGNNPISLEPKSSHVSTYLSSPGPYQYNTPNTFLDNVQSTPAPGVSFLSTPVNNGQYSSQFSTYVSSATPAYISSPTNQQPFVSSPLSIIQTGSPEFNDRDTSVGSKSFNYDNNDHSALRYSINVQQQLQNEFTTTTTHSPLMYSEPIKDLWQNNLNSANTGASKPLQDSIYNNYQNYQNQVKQENVRPDTYGDNNNSETHRIGSMTSANNMFINYMQPDSQALNNLRFRTRDLDRETSKTDRYSNGDFGWKLTGKKPVIDFYSSTSYPRYPTSNIGNNDGIAVSHVNFNMDTIKPYNVNQNLKPSDNIEKEFAQAAAKAHDQFKQQQQLQQQQQQLQQQQQQQQLRQHQYPNINSLRTNTAGGNDVYSPEKSYYNNMEKQKNKVTDSRSNYFSYGFQQNDIITPSPYYLPTARDNVDDKMKHPFDHDKALKNIVPIDVSNVVGNSESKAMTTPENYTKYISLNYGKDQPNLNFQDFVQSVSDSFYKDKNAMYGMNIKTKSNDYSLEDSFKQQESSAYNPQIQSQETNYNLGYTGGPRGLSYLSQQSNKFHDSLQSSSIHQPELLRNQNQITADLGSIFKFNDIPYKFAQGLSNDALKLHNHHFDQGDVLSPLPMRINQNVGSHQLDVTTNLLNKLLLSKPPTNIQNNEMDSQTSGLLPTINGFKVANPFNVDLKLVAELLKGKPTVDESHMVSLRDQYTNHLPQNLDFNSQLQQLLGNKNNGNLSPINEGLGALSNSYVDLYTNSRQPYQKYSRSQEEEESIVPIAAASNAHPIGAVIEQDDSASEREVSTDEDFTAQDDVLQDNFDENKFKTRYISESGTVGERHRYPNLLMPGRNTYQKKHYKIGMREPYPLLKPPPPNRTSRGGHSKYNRRRSVHKPRLLRSASVEREPLFEAGADPENLNKPVTTILRPPAPVAEAKSDIVDTKPTA